MPRREVCCLRPHTALQEILEVEQLMAEEDAGLELTAENVERSLDEIRCATCRPVQQPDKHTVLDGTFGISSHCAVALLLVVLGCCIWAELYCHQHLPHCVTRHD